MATRNPATADARFGHMEAQVEKVASVLTSFIAETRDHRDRQDKGQNDIWVAIKEMGERNTLLQRESSIALLAQGARFEDGQKTQSHQMQKAIENLTQRGEIRWPAIVTTVVMLVVLATAVSGVLWTLSESRIRQLEITDAANQRIHDANMETVKVQVANLHELGRENHGLIRDLTNKEIHENAKP